MNILTKTINPSMQHVYESIDTTLRYPSDAPIPVDPTKYVKADHYLGNKLIKRAGAKTTWTPELLEEYSRCKDDILYFAERYFNIINVDEGRQRIKLYDFQKEILRLLEKPDARIFQLLSCRQASKTTILTIYILHYALFNQDKTIALLANKGRTASMILSRIRMALELIPFWLQTGVAVYNKNSIEFESRTSIISAATSNDSIRGASINLLYIDEMAFVANDLEFMESTFPTIASGKTTKFITTSTPNGLGNVFHTSWEKAVSGVSTSVIYKVTWDMVPGRDEEWKEFTISNSSLSAFMQEHECQFRGTDRTLVSPPILEIMASDVIDPLSGFDTNDQIKIYATPDEGRKYLATVDVGEGGGGDYSTFTIFDITSMPYKQALVFRDNEISPMLFSTMINKWLRRYNDPLVVVENNSIGMLVARDLHLDIGYPNVYCQGMIKETDIGVRTTSKIKASGCSTLKSLIENGKLKIQDKDAFRELCTFEAKGASWEATQNNYDDLVANLWMFAWFTLQPAFSSDTNIRLELYEDQIDIIESEENVFTEYSEELPQTQNTFW